MMPACLAKIIRVLWSKGVLSGLLLLTLIVARPAAAQSALALLAEGINAAQREQYDQAARSLRAAQRRLPLLADYAGYWLAWAEFGRRNYAEALRALEPVWNCPIGSPLAGKAALLGARAHLESGNSQEAVKLLKTRWEELPQPDGEFLLGSAWEAAGQPARAAVAYQRVYYGYPASPQAREAGQALERLRRQLGNSYPPPLPQDMLQRADYWLRSRQYRAARAEYQALENQLGGRERELARVRWGAALYFDYDTRSAWEYLRSLEPADPEADAERLYYLAECARRLDLETEMLSFVERLGRLYPNSPWRLKALISAGNRYLLDNQPEKYEPLYRACYENFPEDPEAAYCHWKVAWSLYLARRPEAREALSRHLQRYPSSEQAPAALYFLGRLAEAAGQLGAARAWYEGLLARFPNYYYGALARRKLADAALAKAAPAPAVAELLAKISWPQRSPGDGFHPQANTKQRLERARLLHAAGLSEASFEELRFGARRDGQPHLAAQELAALMAPVEPPYRILQVIKQLVPGYLGFQREEAPKRFWHLAFPFPYRSLIETWARRHRLDPFLLAGLIRQESEFNPGAMSPARACGLTQLLPSQARMLARQLKLRYRTSYLFQPAMNIRLGAYYLRSLLDKYEGRVEVALAAYNAGANRAERWLNWGKFQEPAEFIETIPFTETRTYVQAVLRNAEFYRWLYGSPSVVRKAPQATPRRRPRTSPR